VYLRFLNKKLPKKEGDKVSITDTIDLESLRLQYVGKNNLSLETKVGELEPIYGEGSKVIKEEEKELLSEIIKKVNEVFGIELKDDDKVDLMSVKKKTLENIGLEEKMRGDNSYDDKKEEFMSVVKDIVSDYYTDKMEFYRKVMDNRVFPMLIDGMFTDYMKEMRL
jgi:type I restriction enzyme R subunit